MSNENTATETKQPTLATQIKRAFVEFMDSAINAGFSPDKLFTVKGVPAEQIAALFDLRAEVGEGRVAQSLADRLAAVDAEIDEHYATMPMKNGKPAPDAAFNETTLKLLARKARIERSIREGGDHPEPKGESASA